MSRRLFDFTTLTFDCYGTLIDWETGLWDALQPLLAANGRDDLSRAELLATHAYLESELEKAQPAMAYPDVLAAVHRGLAERHGLRTSGELDAAYGASLPHWPAFGDSAEALGRLSGRYRLVILSNVHRAGIAASMRQLGVAFDAVYTAEEIGSYKPARRNFEYALERLKREHGVARGEVLHTAQSLFHDHAPASALGLATAWIDRQGLAEGGAWGATRATEEIPPVDFRFPSLAAMAEAVEAESGS